jgi:hypothetical protein
MIKIIISLLLLTGMAQAQTTGYLYNGINQAVTIDTVSAPKSRPLPIMPVNASGARVNPATDESVLLVNAKLPVGISVNSPTSELLVRSSQGTSPWVVSMPSPDFVRQGTNPWIVSNATDAFVKQGTSPWIISAATNLPVNQGTSPWIVSVPNNQTVLQGTNPWVISSALGLDSRIRDTAGASVTVGQKTMAASLPITMASDQGPMGISMPQYVSGSQVNTALAATTASTASPPANAVGVIVQAPDNNTHNIRYRIGGVASPTAGMQLQPGRDSGFIPVSSAVSVCAETSGTNAFQIQWISK